MNYNDLFTLGRGLNDLKELKIIGGDARLFLNLNKIEKRVKELQDEFFEAKEKAYAEMDKNGKTEEDKKDLFIKMLEEECEDIGYSLTYNDLEKFEEVKFETISNLSEILIEE